MAPRKTPGEAPPPPEHPKLFDHAVDLYGRFAAKADKDGVFTGYKRDIMQGFPVSPTYYTKVYKALLDMECILEVQTGNARQPSILRLVDVPELERFREVRGRKPLTRRPSITTMASDIEVLQRRLPSIDLSQYIANLEGRLIELEKRLTTLEGAAKIGQ